MSPVPDPITRTNRDQTWDQGGQLVADVERVENITEFVHALVADAVLRDALEQNLLLLQAESITRDELVGHLQRLAQQQSSVIRILLEDFADVDPVPVDGAEFISPQLDEVQADLAVLDTRVETLETTGGPPGAG
jgi:hypothetical protein